MRDRNEPVARIVPYVPESIEEQEKLLIARGILRPPKNPAPDRDKWVKEFLARPRPKVSGRLAIQALLDEREESR